MTPSNHPSLFRFAVLGAVVFGIGSPILQSLADIGLSAAEFASDGDETLRAEGYAFSIWSVIYAWLIGYAVFLFTHPGASSPVAHRMAPAAFLAIMGTGAWIWASAFDLKAATLVIISGSALVLATALWRERATPLNQAERIWVLAPLGLHAGWLTVATSLNALTVMTAWGYIDSTNATAWSAVAVVFAVVVGAFVTWSGRIPTYGLAIGWGLVAVGVAEHEARPAIALAAAVGGAALATLALYVMTRRRSAPRTAPVIAT